MQINTKKMQKNLHMSEKSSTFAPAFVQKPLVWFPRDVNQRSVCGPKA